MIEDSYHFTYVRMGKTVDIHIRLQHNGTDVFRPAKAREFRRVCSRFFRHLTMTLARNILKPQWLAAGVFVLFFGLFCMAQQPSVEPKSPLTTLHAATRLILLDVVVTDKHGKPIRSLLMNDFTIQEDGEEQAIASFEGPNGHAPVPLEKNLKSAGDGKNATQSAANAMISAPLTVLVLDELDTMVLDQAYARHQIRRYLHAHGPTAAGTHGTDGTWGKAS